jgi:hypothetical protein
MAKHRLFACAVLLSALPVIAQAAECNGISKVGQWNAAPDFISLLGGQACQRQYNCGPAQQEMMSNACHVVGDSKPVLGPCSGTSGCDDCNTNPPTESCNWHEEPN